MLSFKCAAKKLFITFRNFQEKKWGAGKENCAGGAGSGVPGQLRSQGEPWCRRLGCGKPKPLGSFMERVLCGKPNFVPPPVAMGMGNAPLQRRQHTEVRGKKDLRLLLFPRHSTCSSKRKLEVCFPHIR